MGGADLVSLVKGPKEAYHALAEKGAITAQDSSIKIFFQSFYAGCYIGFGALLATVISGNLQGWTEENPAVESFVFAALFPVNLLLILLTGGILFTGTSAACPAAVYEGKASILNTLRCLAISWWGNLLGSLVFAYFTQSCELLEGVTKATIMKIAVKKTAKGFGTTFLKGIGCNWMVCMAVFLQGQAQDMCGKYLGIWFPISTFVMIGFEHIPANFYLLSLALVGGSKEEKGVDFVDVLWKNWIPVTLGNFVAGAIIVAAGYSFAFGRLGSGQVLDMKMSARKSLGAESFEKADVEAPKEEEKEAATEKDADTRAGA
jgi:formate/nitrite transporter